MFCLTSATELTGFFPQVASKSNRRETLERLTAVIHSGIAIGRNDVSPDCQRVYESRLSHRNIFYKPVPMGYQVPVNWTAALSRLGITQHRVRQLPFDSLRLAGFQKASSY